MRQLITVLFGGFVFIGGALLFLRTMENRAHSDQPVAMNVDAPEFAGIDEWINDKPLTLKDLKGKVVVLHFWTFG